MRDYDLDEGKDIVWLAGVHWMQYSMQYIYFCLNEFNLVKFNFLFFARVYVSIVQINLGSNHRNWCPGILLCIILSNNTWILVFRTAGHPFMWQRSRATCLWSPCWWPGGPTWRRWTRWGPYHSWHVGAVPVVCCIRVCLITPIRLRCHQCKYVPQRVLLWV